MTTMLRVKNFERFQHYKDRSPPWIKLYTELLDDYEFSLLSDVAKAHLILLWLVASKMDNRIPNDPRWLAKRVPTEQPINVEELLDAGFIERCDEQERNDTRQSWHSRYISTAVRAEVLGRTNGKCASCGSPDHIEIDHIVPISQGGSGDASNLQALCRKCNRSKRTKTVTYPTSSRAEQGATQMRRPEGETETEQRQRREEEAAAAPLTERFTVDEHRRAYAAYRLAHRMPDGLDAALRNAHQPMTHGRSASWEQIGAALVEMRAAQVAFSPNALAGFLRRLDRSEGLTPHEAKQARLKAAGDKLDAEIAAGKRTELF